jgi:drug/metabolite transporter (DMT)-like permease
MWSTILAYITCALVWVWGIAPEDAKGAVKALSLYPILAVITGALVGSYLMDVTLSPKDWFAVALGLIAVIILGQKDVTG